MPRQGSAIVHPDVLAATGRFARACTVQRATVTVNDTGDEVLTWADLLTGVACTVSTNTPGGGTGSTTGRRGEQRREDQSVEFAPYTILLAGERAVTPKDRAVVDGVTYDIRSVEHDSQGIMTRLWCEVVR